MVVDVRRRRGAPAIDGEGAAAAAIGQRVLQPGETQGGHRQRSHRRDQPASGPLRELVDDYLQALFGQISQAAACNRLHSTEERLSRWLLMSHDRVGTDEFAITHEFLGRMLGARRATVTLSAGILQAAGLIRYHRGQVTIVDRAGLESVACECCGVIETELNGVVQRALRRSPANEAWTT
jgi:hypothetical protein